MQQPERDAGLPSFLIIGAIKGATTWLSHHLGKSAGVFLPATEPHYFTREYTRGLDWYRDHFRQAAPQQIVGEKTADYLANPDAPGRAAALLPNVLLVASLRDPVERAYSDYCMLFRRGSVSRRIEDYLDPRRAEFLRFLENGLYHRHLSRWLDRFSREQLLVLTMEDVTHAPDASLQELARFIGLREELIPAADHERVNDSRRLFLPLEVRRLLAPLKGLAAPLRRSAAFEALRAPLARPISYPALTDELRDRLSAYYRRDIDDLQALLGRDLSHWASTTERKAA